MSYEMIVGLEVRDSKLYADYREAMAPLLRRHGGGFRYDFEVARVLRSESKHQINRVFAIYFKDRENKVAFFAHPDYQAIKAKYFERSVASTTIISEYLRFETAM